MPFDPHKTEAQIVLGEIFPEDLPLVACDALEAGYEGPAILRMAILNNPSGWETDQILPAFLKETGMNLLSKEDASVRLAYDLALQVIESRQDPIPLLRKIAALCSAADYPNALLPLYMLDDEMYVDESVFGRSVDAVRRDAHDALITLIRDYEAKQNIP